MRRRIAVGNWKMFKTNADTAAFFDALAPLLDGIPPAVELVVCPPFTALGTAGVALREPRMQRRVSLGAQNVHWAREGAFTGEISGPMLGELGVRYAIVGHSERREYFGETDEDVRRRTAAALEFGITPIVAVGETLAIRRAGGTRDHVVAQIAAVLSVLDDERIARLVIAYEPCWAIGTGENCAPGDANDVMQTIRSCSPALQNVPILYGGSVKPENAGLYAMQPDIDGALIGGASLDPASYAAIAAALASAQREPA